MTGKYQTYPDYSESAVKWLGAVPASWNVIRVGHLFKRTKRTGHSDKELLSVYRDHGVVPKNSRDDNNNKASEDLSAYQLVEPKNLVLNKMKAWQGSVAVSDYVGIVSPAYFVYEPVGEKGANYNARYIHYLLRSPQYISQYLRYSKGIRVNQWDLDPDMFKSLEVLIPNPEEQRTIAAFLDYETAHIDTLIAKQQRLIELLKEKRQAVISHAVTKGLNPDAPMKDSGVEWLGEVPEHWTVSKFGFLKTVLTDYTANGSFADLKKNVTYIDNPSYARLVRLTDLRKNLENDNGVWIDENSYHYLSKSALYGGEFLLANVGAYAGLFYQMPEDKGPASLAPNMFMAKFDSRKVSRGFMTLIGQSDGVFKQLRLSALASSAQPKLNKDDFKSIRFAFPPIEEQGTIVRYVAAQESNFSKLLESAELSVALMQERRTALISAAVTGKIDVRDWQPPAQEHAA